jgi:hypothetical protein
MIITTHGLAHRQHAAVAAGSGCVPAAICPDVVKKIMISPAVETVDAREDVQSGFRHPLHTPSAMPGLPPYRAAATAALHAATLAATFAAAMLLAACSPHFDWREVHGSDAPYTVLMPAKPASHVRQVNLGGTETAMTMTAVDLDGTLFAVGTATLPDADSAAHALAAMRTALVRNIGGTVTREKATAESGMSTLDFEAADSSQGRLLAGHLVARDTRVYQVVAIGTGKSLPREAIDTFLTSFKLN